jgi:hypothetical protein
MANVDTNTLCQQGIYLILKKKNHSDSIKMFSETDVINMLEFLIDNIFVGIDAIYEIAKPTLFSERTSSI